MKFLVSFILIITFGSIANAQLPNFNMQFLANLNQHITTDTYSGCWGYVDSSGREYAILGTHLGTAFIDITDDQNIHEVDFAPTPISGSGNHWREITVYSNYAYVVTEEAGCGIEIFDLSYLPDSVSLVRRFIPPNHTTTHTISVSGPYIYLNGCNATFGQGITVLDLTANPELPIVRGSLNSHIVHDAKIINDTIWAACLGNGMRVVNAVNKDQLSFITSFGTPPHNTTHNSALSKDGKYLFTTDETSTPTAGTLKIFNVDNLGNVTFIREWRPAGITTSQVHNIEIYGDTAVIAHRSSGVRVLDISNPEVPVEIAWYDTFPLNNNNAFIGAWGVFKFPSNKIIVSNKEDGLWVLKLGTPTQINSNVEVVSEYRLLQNYPNPFNPNTKIKFVVPDDIDADKVRVMISVYDVSGREVRELVNGFFASGEYATEFDAGELSGGIYFYEMTSGNFSEVKKMIVIK